VCFVSQPALCSTELRRRPREFERDAAIAQFDVEDGAGLHVVPFYEERYVVVASNNLLLSSDSAMRWVDAAQLPLALLTPDMRIRQ
jgi:DNA-binding transcriptional LysR family regulator